ncbi:tumor p53-inducible nuclear 1 isoform X1 [Pelobates cultripes]|uniref:Tumor p53-inducible nuclear 1 isoform X1 n=1 Tax=Pelobates cultripes TaxID=61616 RepID=A0AAD1S1H7_PELCU|nr:tumor p53-inducible nuclear 1 isoform X1 [Pelobates cultripes]
MFQMFTYVFGAASNVSSQEPEFSEKNDDEWILVDIIEISVGSHDVIQQTGGQGVILYRDCPYPNMDSLGAFEPFENTSDSVFVHFNPSSMEESWFVTPPPCFTARELTTTEVETSPMENLLIEHPSMSVYAVRNLCHKEVAACDLEYPVFDVSELLKLTKENEKKGRQHAHCYVAALAARMNYLEKTKKFNCSKLSRQQSEKYFLNRKSLRHQNLIQGSHCRQIKHSGLVHQPCKRRYNY